MVRQAHTYLVGAVSGVTLIGIAIAVFVVLVSAQVFKDWPASAFGGGDQTTSVSEAKPVAGPGDGSAAAGATGAAPATGANATTTASRAGSTGSHHGVHNKGSQGDAAAPPNIVSDVPAPGASGPETTSPGSNSGGGPGSGSKPSSGSDPTSNSGPDPSPASAGNGNSAGTTSSSGSGQTKTPSTPKTTESAPVQPIAPPSSGTVTGTVNGVVNGVDESVTGGALKETGVTGTVETVVEGVAGPESAVGKTVDEAGKVVGGLLGGNH